MTSEWVIVKSKIKEMVGTYNVSADFSEELNKKVKASPDTIEGYLILLV